MIASFEAFGCRYPGQSRPLLDGIDLELRAGEITTLIGPSGSGKSSLALALNGVLQHVLHAETQGRVRVDGFDVAERAVEELATQVGVVFQDPESQLVSLYVADEVAFGPENLALPRQECIQRVAESLAFVGLDGFERRFVYELSGGEKQKLALAAVLAMRPRLLVFDEPTANMDPASSSEMWTLVRRVRDQGIAVLVIEKEMDDVAPLADRLAVLDDGRVRLAGDPRRILAEQGGDLRDRLGVWIPQVCECELELRNRGLAARELPLTAAEAAATYASRVRVGRTDGPAAPPSADKGGGVPAAVGGSARESTSAATDAGRADAGMAGGPATPPPANLEDGPPSAAAGAAGSAPSGAPLVEVRHVSFAYVDGTTALRDVTFDLRPGEVLALVGHNGSGKTTLVKQIVGLLRPDSGSVTVFGRRQSEPKRRQRLWREVGFVFQFPDHQFVRDTVADELRFSLQVAGTPDGEVEPRVAEMLRRLDLQGLEDRHPFTLSGGEKRRLSVATVLIARPRLLILDEPTYAQDRRSTLQLMQEVSRLAAGDPAAGAILVTHDMRLVGDFAHRAVVMSGGRPIFDGTVADLFARPEVLQAARLKPPPVVELIGRLRASGLDLGGTASMRDLVCALADRRGVSA